MESQNCQGDNPDCLAIVEYTGGRTNTDNEQSGDLGVNHVSDNEHDGALIVGNPGNVWKSMDDLDRWSRARLWEATETGTAEQFFQHGPFTLNASDGRRGEAGNLIALSYFKLVVESFCEPNLRLVKAHEAT